MARCGKTAPGFHDYAHSNNRRSSGDSLQTFSTLAHSRSTSSFIYSSCKLHAPDDICACRSCAAHSMRYSKMLEENQFSGRKADYVWLLIVSSTLLLLLSPLSPAPFLSSPLSFTLVYLWSRLNPSVRLSLFGVVTITAPYLPYALVVFSWALASSWSAVIGDLLGITVGHVWYFFTRVWRHERGSGNKNWLATPPLLTRILDGRERLHVE